MKLYKIINPDTTSIFLFGLMAGILLSRYVINREEIKEGKKVLGD